MDGLLHRALAVAPPGRTGHHARPVVLGHGHEAGLDDAGLRVDDGRHAVDAPLAGVAPEAAQHAVHGLDQMGLVLGLGEDARNLPEHGSEPTSRWASPPQGASGSSTQSHWISSPGGWSISMVARPFTPAQASQCGRSCVGAQAPGEALVAEGEPESGHLVIEGAGPDVGVFAQPFAQIGHERLEGVGAASFAHAGGPRRRSGSCGSSPGPGPGVGRWPRSIQPCLRSAVASMSSFPVNMREVPFPRLWFGHQKLRKGATLSGGSSVHRGTRVVNFNEQVW